VPVPKQYGQPCPVAKSLELLGERWTLLIVRDLLRAPRKFQDFQASLAGVTPGVLSQRLKLLEESGVVDRRMYSEHPPRAEYALTPRGEELRPIVRAMAIWGAKHLDAGLVLVHDACETPIEMAYYCPSCETEIEWTESSYRKKAGKTRRGGDTVREGPARRRRDPGVKR
jgi:DNA-binding HxlR family transcriptional regulator